MVIVSSFVLLSVAQPFGCCCQFTSGWSEAIELHA